MVQRQRAFFHFPVHISSQWSTTQNNHSTTGRRNKVVHISIATRADVDRKTWYSVSFWLNPWPTAGANYSLAAPQNGWWTADNDVCHLDRQTGRELTKVSAAFDWYVGRQLLQIAAALVGTDSCSSTEGHIACCWWNTEVLAALSSQHQPARLADCEHANTGRTHRWLKLEPATG